jgi:apolipoprotein N-acyltransferase
MAAVGLGLAICAANVGFGVERLAEAQPRSVRVAAMVDESTITKASHMGTQDAAVEISRTYAKAIRSTGAKFAVTPEGGIFTRPQWRLTVLAPLAAVSKQEGIQIIAGVLQRKPWGDLAYSITPDGMVQSYAKRHPVPGLEDNFTPGHASGWLGQGRAMEICKDMDFPDTIRRDAVKGVRLMGEPAGDFGIDGWLHARMSVMRGVEDGFALVRAANDGWVTASDAEGRLIASKVAAPTGLTMIVANLPFGPGPTLYARIGDVFAWLCIAASLGIAAYALRIASRIGGIGVHGWPGQARP